MRRLDEEPEAAFQSLAAAAELVPQDVELRLARSLRHPPHSGDVPAGVYVISPRGELLGRIPVPEDVITNLAFGGPGKKTLFITAGKTIYKIPTAVSGYSIFP